MQPITHANLETFAMRFKLEHETFLALIHAALFQLVWFACVLGRGWLGPLVAGFALVTYAFLFRPKRRAWLFVLSVAAIGVIVDGSLRWLGVLQFLEEPLFVLPAWIVAIWLLFATTPLGCLGWLGGRGLMTSLAGGIAGAATYLAGVKLGAVTFGIATPLALLVIFLLWAGLLPLFFGLAARLGLRDVG